MGPWGGVLAVRAVDGKEMIAAYRRLAGTPGWTLMVSEPRAAFDARWGNPRAVLALGSIAALVIAAFLASWLARLLLNMVKGLGETARSVAEDGAPPSHAGKPLTVADFEVLRQSFEAARESIARRTAQLTIAEQRYRALAEAGALVMWRRSAEGPMLGLEGWTELTGMPTGMALTGAWTDAVHPDDRRQMEDGWNAGKAGESLLDFEFRIMTGTGAWRWVRARGAPVRDADGQVLEWMGVLEDAEERRQIHARLTHFANHDALTGLANRRLLTERLGQLLARGRLGAVLALDLDRFKEINDTYGHILGDRLLREVAARLRRTVNASDTISRLGGDEFVILQFSIKKRVDAAHLAAALVAALTEPYFLEGIELAVGASVGVAVFDRDPPDEQQLLAMTDKALYAAKAAGGNCYRVA